ncbi:hypothetical protein [Paenibacillus nasutitermitis]|uniref:Uncharacterized protein n=1 Tax=Paenibacillus nasutitermitis TaxID=1652958 RepID=A0A917DRX1_9BACL|nr:hypothetical protein [Paenibacillus nasutitermitis]GGD61165.1 hypothetical protein GCM10010911_18770 [Paenibacillus nasutitermitis]
MSKFISSLGGVIGGFSLIYVPISDLLPSLESLFDAVGIIVVSVFAVALIVNGVRSLFHRV